MSSVLIIVSLRATTNQETRLQEFVEWMGVRTESLVLDTSEGLLQRLEDETSAGCHWAMTASTLAAIHRELSDSGPLARNIEERCSTLLVIGWTNGSIHDSALSWLTKKRVDRTDLSVEPSRHETVYHFPAAGRTWSRQFAELEFSAGHEEVHPVFEVSAHASGTTAILLASGKPAFLHIALPGGCQIFLISGLGAPDVNQPLSREKGIEKLYNRIIPLLIVVRATFGDYSWHGVQNTARLIIDDPLLADTYGCLNYANLFESMQRQQFGTTIAFIPWNHRRTSKRWARDFLEKKVNLSICIHGCDHTNREFSSMDSATLAYKAGVSVTRMEKHQDRTGVPFEEVMVFPQGHFSEAAILALRRNKYLAAVNTTCFPTDGAPDALRIGDFLRPAVTRFSGFPIFQRLYPERLIDFAFDLFLGRPAFIVEHHPYFDDGCAKLESFVQELRRLEPDLTWPTLSSQLQKSCLVRRSIGDFFEVRFYTRKFVFKNEQSAKKRFAMEKDEPDVSAVCRVLIDGKPVPFSSKQNSIRFEVEMEAGQVMHVEILDRAFEQLPPKRFGLRYSLRVFLRRKLSEFRDNTLSKNSALLGGARKIAKSLKVTGDKGAKTKLGSQRSGAEKGGQR